MKPERGDEMDECSKGGEPQWGTDGAHLNVFCKKCFIDKPGETELKADFTLPPEFGLDDMMNRRVACIFNADVKEFIRDIEQYDGSYIDPRFWKSTFWKKLTDKYK